MRKENRKAGKRLWTGINRVLSVVFAASLLTSAWYVNPTGAAGNYGAVKVYAEETDEMGLPVSEETVPEEGVSGDSLIFEEEENILVEDDESEDVQTNEKIIDEITWKYSVKSDNTVEIKGCEYSGIKTEITIPSIIDELTVTSIGDEIYCHTGMLATYSVYRYIEKINMPESVEKIGDKAFFSCGSLADINIPNGMKDIGNYSLGNCPHLHDISIPSTVEHLGINAFHTCSTNITVDEKNLKYESKNGCVIEKDTGRLILGFNDSTIPNGVKEIENYAFYLCKKSSIVIPDSVTNIGDYTFAGSNFANMDIPNGVVSIGKGAFYRCSNLTRINIPNSITSIGYEAFAFSGITDIKIPEGVTKIEERTFLSCSNLASINMSNSVTDIGESAFSGCSSLADVYYSGSKSDWDKIKIEDYNEKLLNANIHYEKTDSQQSVTPAPTDNKAPVTNKTSVKAENGSQVTTTDKGTAALTMAAPSGKKTVSVPSTVTVDGVTYDVTEVGANAFKDLKKTTTVILPKTVKKIKANAFTKSKIKTVKLTVSKGQKLTIDKKAFKNSKVQKVQLTVSKKATEKEIKALKKALKKAGIKENNIKISKKLK